MSSVPFTNYRLDWEQFCAAQPDTVAADLRRLLAASQGFDDAADVALADAVERASHDTVMARLVLQRVMPGLIAVAKRRSRIEANGFCDILHDLVANGWIAVRTYPLARRPHRIAANLVRDIEYLTFVQPRRLRRVSTTTMSPQIVDHPSIGNTNPSKELLDMFAAARSAGADPAGVRLLGELTLAGRSVTELATAYSVTPRTILNRRLAAQSDLRRVAVSAA